MSGYFSCDDPDCHCDEPAFTDPIDALRFLSGRFKYAGVSDGVALSYAHDIDLILANLPIDYELTEQGKALLAGGE